jgi:ParB family chromosome partitioning protein
LNLASKPVFRDNIQRLFDEAVSTELTPGLVSLIESRDLKAQIRELPVNRILPNPAQPRLSYEEDSLRELAASIREHGVLQPIIVRPVGSDFELIAGERRWRASRLADRESVPAIVVELDAEAALEVSIIENLQREDVSPLEEAAMYRRMLALGYSVRQLATKIGKDKGYVENRIRLTDAPQEIRDLVATRKDTISHAYELMKVTDERKRKRLAKRVAAGELSLAQLRVATGSVTRIREAVEPAKPRGRTRAGAVAIVVQTDDALVDVRAKLAEAIDELSELLRNRDVIDEIPATNRDNLAKHLTITKLKLENAITIVRATREE